MTLDRWLAFARHSPAGAKAAVMMRFTLYGKPVTRVELYQEGSVWIEIDDGRGKWLEPQQVAAIAS